LLASDSDNQFLPIAQAPLGERRKESGRAGIGCSLVDRVDGGAVALGGRE
jgi:hypothetical protein